LENFELNIGSATATLGDEIPEASEFLWAYLKDSGLDNINFHQYFNLSSNHRFFISHDYLLAVVVNSIFPPEPGSFPLSSFYDLLVFSHEEVESETETVLSLIHEAASRNSLIRDN
jgi:very-short-patch-repair endonuclease